MLYFVWASRAVLIKPIPRAQWRVSGKTCFVPLFAKKISGRNMLSETKSTGLKGCLTHFGSTTSQDLEISMMYQVAWQRLRMIFRQYRWCVVWSKICSLIYQEGTKLMASSADCCDPVWLCTTWGHYCAACSGDWWQLWKWTASEANVLHMEKLHIALPIWLGRFCIVQDPWAPDSKYFSTKQIRSLCVMYNHMS